MVDVVEIRTDLIQKSKLHSYAILIKTFNNFTFKRACSKKCEMPAEKAPINSKIFFTNKI